LHGLAQSGQVHELESWLAETGNRDRSQLANTSSMSRGISPASSFAAKTALAAIACSARRQSASPITSTPSRTRYGFGREPCTRASTTPGRTSRSITWPLRA